MNQAQLPELIRTLLDPKSYPHSPLRVELVQTQMSFIFLAGDLVYKVKKPVNLGYLDYTTLEQRHFFCRKEVELNRRLCPEAYLGVVAIAEQAYLNNKKKFEAVDLNDLKSLYPDLDIVHLIVNTNQDQPEDWYVIGVEQK